VIFDIQKFSINDGPGIRTTVFFKGCPLKCPWCSNPESQNTDPELLYFDNLCKRCYRCVEICPNRATAIAPDGSLSIDREKCKACGACVDVCFSEARIVSGRRVTVNEVLESVRKDSLFYRTSGGGVTVSGGEPTAQPKFLTELLRRCQEIGFHTVLDTCGQVPWKVMEKVLQYVDLVLFDIKHMDPIKHTEIAGVNNDIILENARRIALMRKPMVVRLPLVPGMNDSMGNLKATAQFMGRIKVRSIDLIPYHRLGINKYKRLGKEYKLSSVKPFMEEEIDLFKRMLEAQDLEVSLA
jgi:glycyl-radical enzyme activating protein